MRSSLVCLAVAVTATSLIGSVGGSALAQARTRPKTRAVEQEYVGGNYGVSAVALEFQARRGEKAVTVKIEDATGRAVDANTWQGDGTDPHQFCNSTGPVPIDPHKPVYVYLWVGFSSCPLEEWPSLPSTGTVTVTFLRR